MAGPFEDFINSQATPKSQPKQAGSFAEFMAAEESNPALPVGAEKTGLPGVPLRLPQIEEQGLPGTVASGAAETFDSFMRGGAQAVNSSIRGIGGGVQAVDRALQSLNPLNPSRGQSAVGAVGQKLVEFADQQQRWDASAKPAYATALEQKQADILDHPELLKEPAFWTNMGGNVVGSMLTMLPAGMGAASKADKVAYLAGRFAPAVRAAAGPGAAAFVETFMDAGNTYQDAIDAGHSPEMAGRVAAEVFAREFPTTVAFDAAGLFNEGIKGRLRHVVSAITEGGQEVAQGLAQRTAERDILGNQQSIWGPVPLELLSGLMGGPVGSLLLGGGRRMEASLPIGPQSPQVAEDVAAQSGLETPAVRPSSPSTQVETIPAAPETISAKPETKGPQRETIPQKTDTARPEPPVDIESFEDFMRRDEESQRAIADADTMLADIEPAAFEAGRRAKENEGNPFDGLLEADARIRAAAFEAGRKRAIEDAEFNQVPEDWQPEGDVDRGIDPVSVLPEAADAGVSGPERTGDARDVDGVPAVQPRDGNPPTAAEPPVAKPGKEQKLATWTKILDKSKADNNPRLVKEAKRRVAMYTKPSKPVEKQEVSTAKPVIQQERPKTREFAKAVAQHGRWEDIYLKAVREGNTRLEAAAARMVDKYGAKIRAEIPDEMPVMAAEIRRDYDESIQRAKGMQANDEFGPRAPIVTPQIVLQAKQPTQTPTPTQAPTPTQTQPQAEPTQTQAQPTQQAQPQTPTQEAVGKPSTPKTEDVKVEPAKKEQQPSGEDVKSSQDPAEPATPAATEKPDDTGAGSPGPGTERQRTRSRKPRGAGDGAKPKRRTELVAGARTGDGADPSARVEEPNPEPSPEDKRKDANRSTGLEGDYRIPDNREIYGSPERRARTNIAAIRLLRELEQSGRAPSPEERDVLASYVGWGAVPQLFARKDESFAALDDELKGLISAEEYDSARRSTTNAHYTHDLIVDGMWDAMKHLGAKPGMSWLEPAIGVGNFFGRQPADLLRGARRVGLDKDALTGKIAQLLYPNSGIEITPFEKAELPTAYFDAAISNVPFGDFGVSDPALKNKPYLTGAIHNYFFAKALDYVRPGGVVAFVTSRYTMDAYAKQGQQFREYIAERADLIGAVRLPAGAFRQNAGTDVITDIIFLRRRKEGEPAGGKKWLESKAKLIGKTVHNYSINEYFHKHPEMILGEEGITRGQFSANDYDVKGTVTKENLAEALRRMPGNQFAVESSAKAATRVRAAEVSGSKDVKIGAMFVDGDKLYVRTSRGSVEPLTVPAPTKARIVGQIGIRDALRDLLNLEVTDADEAALSLRRKLLNARYDNFVAKHGPLSSRTNIAAFDGDPDAPLLLALEKDYDPDKKTAQKAPIFTKRMLRKPTRAESADSAKDALYIALNETGNIDFGRMKELTGKSEDALVQELAGVIYQDPQSRQWQTAEEYLSGSVRLKLREAKAAAKIDKRYEANAKALEAVQPPDIPASQISARLGVTWVPRELYAKFIRETFGLPWEPKVSYIGGEMSMWKVQGPFGAATNRSWVTNRQGAEDLIDAAFNLRQVKIYDRSSDGTSELNPVETAAAQAKILELQSRFEEWLFEDDARASAMVRRYNDINNDLRLRTFDGSHLTFAGMSRTVLRGGDLEPHQKAAVWRIISQPNTLLAHAVGAGKTFEMIAGGMELKRLGLVKRPMYVVPNATLTGWQEQFSALYPDARVIVFSEKDLEKSNRQKVMAKIATGEWDAVVMPQSSFGLLPVSDALFEQHFGTLKDELERQIREAKEEKMDTRLIKRMEKAKERLLEQMEKRRAADKKDNLVTWEQLGIDQLFVDESHNYKKMGFGTKQGQVAGIDNQGNQATFDLRMKMDHTRRHGRGIVFATGTPVTNTMGELFSVMKYLIEPEMKARGLSSFDEWASAFGRTVSVFEPKPEGGGYHAKQRFSKFVNLPELIQLFRSFTDVVTSDMLNIPRPALKGGERTAVVSEMTPEQEEFMAGLQKRAESIRQSPRDAFPDNMLAVYSDAAKMALDIRMVQPDAVDDPRSRLNRAADNIVRVWERTAKDKGTQLVVSDLGKPVAESGAAFSAYDSLIEKLVERGIPREEIATVYDAKDKRARAKLFRQVNEGQIRVIMGSTMKIGVGVNIQTRLAALHHMDAPHRPSDIEQREGRILRQGNLNKEVEIFQYMTRGTLDEMKFGALSRKGKFINQVMQGKSDVREAEDVGGLVMSFEQFQAAASGDGRVMRKLEVDSEIDRLSAVRAGWRDRIRQAKAELAGYPLHNESLKRNAQLMRELIAKRDAAGKVWQFGKQKIEGEGTRNDVVTAINRALTEGSGMSYAGIPLHVGLKNEEIANIEIEGLQSIALPEGGVADAGTVQRIQNAVANLDKILEQNEATIKRNLALIDSLKEDVAKPFAYEERLQDLLKEQADLVKALGGDKGDEGADTLDEIKDASVEAAAVEGEEEQEAKAEETPEPKPAVPFAETSLDDRRMASAGAIVGRSAAIRAKNEKRIDAWVLDAIRTAEPRGGNLITRKLREALPGVSKEALDQSIGRLYRAEKILVDRHSGPMLLSEKERDELVYDNQTKAHYVIVSLNMEAKGKRGERGAVSLDLLTGGRAETLIKVIETGKARGADAYAALVKPLAVRIAEEGNGSGQGLAKLLRTARDRGEVAAGQLLAQLDDVKLSKLSKQERIELTDALEGRAEAKSEKVKEAFRRVRALTDSVANVALDLKIQVKGQGQRRDFAPRGDYFPHVIRPAAALKRGRVREDVIANVAHIKAAPDAKAAERMLDEYIGFVESGKKLDKILDYLVETGQARDRATALAQMERFRSVVKREGSLEYSREVNLPFYDPDPARVLAPHLASQAIRLTQIALFGQDDQRINVEILKMREAGANTKMVREAVDRILGRVVEADDAMARVSRLLRSIQTAKLGLAVIPNAFQGTMNSLVAADLPSVMLGWKSALSKEGRRFAIESGAAIEPVLSEAHREFGDSELMSKYLKATGFSATEQFNRVLAANAGKAYLGKLFAAAKAGNSRGNRLLREFIGDGPAVAALQRGSLRDQDVLLGAKRFSDLTQFRTRPEDLPLFASTDMGKVLFQFKSFAYNQTRLMHRETVGAIRNGEIKRGLRTLLVLAMLFPLQGELVRLLREAIKGGDPKEFESAMDRYWAALAASSALGFLGDVLQASGWKRGLEFLAGPTLSTGGDSINLMGTLADDNASDEAKSKAVVKYLRRHLPLGQLWGRFLED